MRKILLLSMLLSILIFSTISVAAQEEVPFHADALSEQRTVIQEARISYQGQERYTVEVPEETKYIAVTLKEGADTTKEYFVRIQNNEFVQIIGPLEKEKATMIPVFPGLVLEILSEEKSASDKENVYATHGQLDSLFTLGFQIGFRIPQLFRDALATEYGIDALVASSVASAVTSSEAKTRG